MIRRLALAAALIASLGIAGAPALAGEEEESTGQKAAETTTKRESIRKLLEITGTPKLGLELAQRIIASMKRRHPNVPEKFWDEFEDEMSEEAFIERIVPVYADNFSKEEIERLIEFYKTDVGQKYVEKLPTLTRASMSAGRQWGRKMGQRVVEKLKRRGYE